MSTALNPIIVSTRQSVSCLSTRKPVGARFYSSKSSELQKEVEKNRKSRKVLPILLDTAAASTAILWQEEWISQKISEYKEAKLRRKKREEKIQRSVEFNISDINQRKDVFNRVCALCEEKNMSTDSRTIDLLVSTIYKLPQSAREEILKAANLLMREGKSITKNYGEIENSNYYPKLISFVESQAFDPKTQQIDWEMIHNLKGMVTTKKFDLPYCLDYLSEVLKSILQEKRSNCITGALTLYPDDTGEIWTNVLLTLKRITIMSPQQDVQKTIMNLTRISDSNVKWRERAEIIETLSRISPQKQDLICSTLSKHNIKPSKEALNILTLLPSHLLKNFIEDSVAAKVYNDDKKMLLLFILALQKESFSNSVFSYWAKIIEKGPHTHAFFVANFIDLDYKFYSYYQAHSPSPLLQDLIQNPFYKQRAREAKVFSLNDRFWPLGHIRQNHALKDPDKTLIRGFERLKQNPTDYHIFLLNPQIPGVFEYSGEITQATDEVNDLLLGGHFSLCPYSALFPTKTKPEKEESLEEIIEHLGQPKPRDIIIVTPPELDQQEKLKLPDIFINAFQNNEMNEILKEEMDQSKSS